ncbi:thiolase family protein [Parapusillimonas granuli]|nr:thiolase family protein [Parapusillimonas granuli]MBB5214736.1 acetyl-CoA acetyltransferase [Parapusillimonas granuli]MEB2398016.1 thiolase family protein [Alcaligenaceae bacterium]
MRSKAIITGIGATEFGALSNENSYTLGARALSAALDDAGMAKSDIDALIVMRIPEYLRFAQLFGIEPGIAMPLPGQGRMSGLAVRLASSLIASGEAANVAIVYGNDGKSAGAKYGGSGDRYAGNDGAVWFPYGMTSPGAVHAMMFSMHAHQYGTTPDALAAIATTFRRHALLNPAAVMRKPITRSDYEQSPFIAEPLRLFDYCLINDGGVAVILSSAHAARDQKNPPVYVRACASALAPGDSGFPPSDYWRAPMQTVAASVYQTAALGPDDMGALMIYDNFSPTVLFTLEGFGYCGHGESGPFVMQGTLALDGGRFPANTNGGHLSESYMQGWGLIAESVRQVRGTAGARQIGGPRNVHYMCAAPLSSSIIFSDSP